MTFVMFFYCFLIVRFLITNGTCLKVLHFQYNSCAATNYIGIFRPTILVATVVNATTLIELKGIKIAATTGDNCPVTAK